MFLLWKYYKNNYRWVFLFYLLFLYLNNIQVRKQQTANVMKIVKRKLYSKANARALSRPLSRRSVALVRVAVLLYAIIVWETRTLRDGAAGSRLSTYIYDKKKKNQKQISLRASGVTVGFPPIVGVRLTVRRRLSSRATWSQSFQSQHTIVYWLLWTQNKPTTTINIAIVTNSNSWLSQWQFEFWNPN